MKLTLKQATAKALQHHDIATLSKIIDQLRSMGWTYESVQKWMEDRFAVDKDTFEGYCYEIDSLGV